VWRIQTRMDRRDEKLVDNTSDEEIKNEIYKFIGIIPTIVCNNADYNKGIKNKKYLKFTITENS